MQLILLSNRLGIAKSIVLREGQLVLGAVSAALFVLFAATALAIFALQQVAGSGSASMQELLVSFSTGPTGSLSNLLTAKLDSIATKIGYLQAQTTVLDLMGERVAALAGLKPHDFRFETLPGQGGAAPAASTGGLSVNEIEHELDQLADQIRIRTDYLDVLESRVLEYTAQKQYLPTMLPVGNAQIGSGFGIRTDPFLGIPTMHEGLDFVADVGTPIMAAGGGVVIFSGFHREFGNLIEIDHGNGVITRYGHCSRLDVKEGDVVRRGQVIAAVGETGHATGPHLHFEIRYKGAAQNPSRFLQADLRRLPKFAHSPVSNTG